MVISSSKKTPLKNEMLPTALVMPLTACSLKKKKIIIFSPSPVLVSECLGFKRSQSHCVLCGVNFACQPASLE